MTRHCPKLMLSEFVYNDPCNGVECRVCSVASVGGRSLVAFNESAAEVLVEYID
jgi:hypothetical protein